MGSLFQWLALSCCFGLANISFSTWLSCLFLQFLFLFFLYFSSNCSLLGVSVQIAVRPRLRPFLVPTRFSAFGSERKSCSEKYVLPTFVGPGKFVLSDRIWSKVLSFAGEFIIIGDCQGVDCLCLSEGGNVLWVLSASAPSACLGSFSLSFRTISWASASGIPS